MSADFSSLELRLFETGALRRLTDAKYYSRESLRREYVDDEKINVEKMMADGVDIYTAIACLVFDTNNPQPIERDAVKYRLFQLLYGG